MPTRILNILCAVVILLPISFCSCNALTWTGTHGEVRYRIHRDLRTHAIVKGQDGSLMYDSPELVLLSDNGKLVINGEDSGDVSKGDLVEITELGTVLVNGQRRGDKMTGHAKMQKRIEQAKAIIETHPEEELKYHENNGS